MHNIDYEKIKNAICDGVYVALKKRDLEIKEKELREKEYRQELLLSRKKITEITYD